MPLLQSSAECAVGAQSMPSSAEFALSIRVSGGVESTQCRVHAEAESKTPKPLHQIISLINNLVLMFIFFVK